MKARVIVTLKTGVLDPQGKAIRDALGTLGFDGVNDVRQGKIFEIDIDADTEEGATARLRDMCERLLANTVIEDYRVEVV